MSSATTNHDGQKNQEVIRKKFKEAVKRISGSLEALTDVVCLNDTLVRSEFQQQIKSLSTRIDALEENPQANLQNQSKGPLDLEDRVKTLENSFREAKESLRLACLGTQSQDGGIEKKIPTQSHGNATHGEDKHGPDAMENATSVEKPPNKRRYRRSSSASLVGADGPMVKAVQKEATAAGATRTEPKHKPVTPDSSASKDSEHRMSSRIASRVSNQTKQSKSTILPNEPSSTKRKADKEPTPSPVKKLPRTSNSAPNAASNLAPLSKLELELYRSDWNQYGKPKGVSFEDYARQRKEEINPPTPRARQQPKEQVAAQEKGEGGRVGKAPRKRKIVGASKAKKASSASVTDDASTGTKSETNDRAPTNEGESIEDDTLFIPMSAEKAPVAKMFARAPVAPMGEKTDTDRNVLNSPLRDDDQSSVTMTGSQLQAERETSDCLLAAFKAQRIK